MDDDLEKVQRGLDNTTNSVIHNVALSALHRVELRLKGMALNPGTIVCPGCGHLAFLRESGRIVPHYASEGVRCSLNDKEPL